MPGGPAIRHLMTDIRRVKRCIIIIIIMAAYRWVYDSRHLHADCHSIRVLLLFLYVLKMFALDCLNKICMYASKMQWSKLGF